MTPSLVIAVVSLLVSIAVAIWNILDRFMNRAEERRRRAPILTSTIECVQGDLEGYPAAGKDLDGRSSRFTFYVETTNSGVNPAERIETEVLCTCDLDEQGQVPLTGVAWWISFANSVPQSNKVRHSESFLLGSMPRRWIRIEQICTDALTGERIVKRCGYIWSGTHDNRIEDLSATQLDKLNAYLDGLSQREMVDHFYWGKGRRPGLVFGGKSEWVETLADQDHALVGYE